MSDATPDPATPPPAAASTPPAAPAAPAGPPFGSDPAKLFHRATGSRRFVTAAITLGVAWVIAIVLEVGWLFRGFTWAIDDGLGDLPFYFRDFGASAFADPFWYAVGAFPLLVFLLPVVASSSLIKVLTRAALAGVGGFIALTLPGMVDGIVDAVNNGFQPGWFLNDWINWPFLVAVKMTGFALGGAAFAWWFDGRPKKEKPAA